MTEPRERDLGAGCWPQPGRRQLSRRRSRLPALEGDFALGERAVRRCVSPRPQCSKKSTHIVHLCTPTPRTKADAAEHWDVFSELRHVIILSLPISKTENEVRFLQRRRIGVRNGCRGNPLVPAGRPIRTHWIQKGKANTVAGATDQLTRFSLNQSHR
jgi:hypothetical protein